MIKTLVSNPDVETLAHFLDGLGDIPPSRIWLNPRPGTATEADVVTADEKQNRLCELVEGTLIEKAMGFKESFLAIELISLLHQFIRANDLGIVLGADGMFRLAPGLVRLPDIAYVSWERLPGRKLPKEAIPELVPNLAVEVISASKTPNEMKRKISEYFTAGVEEVWLVVPDDRTFEIFTSPRKSRIYEKNNALKSALLPDFRLSISEFFERIE